MRRGERELDNQTVLQMNHIMKIYGNGVVANEDVSLICARERFMPCWVRTVRERVL